MHEPQIVKIRLAAESDQAFIDDMNMTATFGANRNELDFPDKGEFFTEHPEVAAFSGGFGRDGDIGLIAEDGAGNPIGAVWGRDFDRSKEDGVLAEHPFEIVLGVRQTERRRGIGHQLLRSFELEAASRGRREISLGVHPKNSARRLYEDVGFRPILNDDGTEARVAGKFVPMLKNI